MRLLATLAAGLMLACAPPAHAAPASFSIAAPDAGQVFLAGEMTDWDAGKVAMQRDENGTWHTALDLEPGQWLYKFVVDGQWVQDPATPDHDADGQGGQHSFMFVGDGPSSIELFVTLPSGEVVHTGGVLALWALGLLSVWLPARRAAAISPATATRMV